MEENLNWFEKFNASEHYKILSENPVAFFCAEYALKSDLPIYAGGLGVLAGDYIREANDRTLPAVGIGLYYNDGYETMYEVGEKGNILEPHEHKSPTEFGLEELLDEKGKRITVDVPVQNRNIKVKVWKWMTGKVPVYLLSTDTPENSEQDRKLTDHLYVVDGETRFIQALILGIGGVRILERLGIKPSLYHMNEGFSSFLSLELIRMEIESKKIGFDEAREIVSKKIIYTNHTLVTGGQDVFSAELLEVSTSKYLTEIGVGLGPVLKLGAAAGSNTFSKSFLALRVAGKMNAVSKLHAKLFVDVWPTSHISSITNGVNIPYWNNVNDEDIWHSHMENKRKLLSKIKEETKLEWDENSFIIGWARRLVPYKRPTAIFEDLDRIMKLLENTDRPVRIVISGTQHPSDIESKKFLQDLRETIDTKTHGKAAFLRGYNLDLAKLLVSGSDIWLNTPKVGLEACGTSGMKAALNGSLPVSTRDGWMDEIDFYGVGWPLDSDKLHASLMDALENEIVPMFFKKDEKGISADWVENMKRSRKMVLDHFSTTRMLRDYVEQLYIPLLSAINGQKK